MEDLSGTSSNKSIRQAEPPELDEKLVDLMVRGQGVVVTLVSGLRGVATAFPPDQKYLWECIKHDTETNCVWWRVKTTESGIPIVRGRQLKDKNNPGL